MNEWLTVKQACAYLGRCEQVIRRYVKDGRLEGNQTAPPTGKILISAASVEKLLTASRYKPRESK